MRELLDLNLFVTQPPETIILGRIKDGRKEVWHEDRPPRPEDIQAHLEGRLLLGLPVDKALHLDFDATPLQDLRPLADALRALKVPFYAGPGNTRGSKVWIFPNPVPDKEELEKLAKALGKLARLLLNPPQLETYPNGRARLFLPLFGALNGEGRPLYRWDRTPVELPFRPEFADLEALRRLARAVPFLEVALQRRPEGERHYAALALLNLAHRAGCLEEVKVLLGTPKLFETWGLQDSRSPESWEEELDRLAEAAAAPDYDRKKGLPALKEYGFDLGPLEGILRAEGEVEVLPLLPEPEAPQPYPLDDLGPLAELAKEVARIYQVPPQMAAGAVLAAVAFGAQGVADLVVDGRAYPASLYLLTVASSGKRKTAVDRAVMRPILEWERDNREHQEKLWHTWRVLYDAWEAERRRILGERKKLGREGLENALEELGPPPEEPWSGVAVFEDTTVEALLAGLDKDWPSLILSVSEGAVFLGGYSFRKEGLLYALGVLSRLWDDGRVRVSRKTGGHKVLEDRRLSAHIGLQPEVFQTFARNHLVAHQGLFSRFLASFIGPVPPRAYQEADLTTTPAYLDYQNRLLELIRRVNRSIREDGRGRVGLDLRRLHLSIPAKEVYKDFYAHCEERRAEHSRAEAFLSKAPEHALRIALVLTLYENPEALNVEEWAMVSGARIADWYAGEWVRVLEGYAPPKQNQDAHELWTWILAQTEGRTPRAVYLKEILRLGPNRFRAKGTAERLLKLLEEYGYLLRREGMEVDGATRRVAWEVNPRAL